MLSIWFPVTSNSGSLAIKFDLFELSATPIFYSRNMGQVLSEFSSWSVSWLITVMLESGDTI